MIKRLLLISLVWVLGTNAQAQVNWLSFEELDSALNASTKPVFIDFYTDWCTYCKKMDKEVFTHDEVIEGLNTSFYAVRFDAESDRVVSFDGAQFAKQENQLFHDLALLLGTRGGQFAPPALVFLDPSFKIKEKHLQYMSRKQILKRIEKYAQD